MVLGARELINRAWFGTICDDAQSPSFREGDLMNYCDVFHFWSLHSRGANFAFADGSVRFLSYSVDPIFPVLVTRAGREVVLLP